MPRTPRTPGSTPATTPRTRLSELECFVLGLVWQGQPCAAYDIRRRLAESPSTQWSASAGAIYPLVARLERRGLLKGRARRTGKRARREYSLTPRGLSALRAWIGPPFDDAAITVTHDPLRSRARFLAALTPSQRKAWVRAARETLDEVERLVRAWGERHTSDDPFAALVTLHGEMDLAFRRAWLGKFAAGRASK